MKLRYMTEDDLELVLSWRNHIEVRKWMFTTDEISLDEHRSWFLKSVNNPDKKLYVLDLGNCLAGFVQFSLSGCRNNPNIEWGFYRAPNSQKGVGFDMLSLAIDEAFLVLNANKIVGQVVDYNYSSRIVHEKLKFDLEGVLKKHSFVNKEYHDVYCYGLFRS